MRKALAEFTVLVVQCLWALVITFVLGAVALIEALDGARGPAAAIAVVAILAYAYAPFHAFAKVRRERDNALLAAHSGEKLADWLGERIREVRIFQRDLKGLPPPSDETYVTVQGIGASLEELRERVLSKLRLTALECVDDFKKGPDWYEARIPSVGSDDRQRVGRLLEYTAGQLNDIREAQP